MRVGKNFVPAGVGGSGSYPTLYKRKDSRHRRRGRPPSRDVLFNRWTQVRGVLVSILHDSAKSCRLGDKWKRVEMMMEALRLQATLGHCFASADYLASHGWGSRKTWDRSLARLRSHELVTTERLYREDGTQSTNLADFSGLWTLILKLLPGGPQSQSFGGELWVKVHGAWLPFAEAASARL